MAPSQTPAAAAAARPVRVVVLGMHRSGTSAVTGLLARAGLTVGAEEELTGRSWENPLGFFERRDVRAICDAMLHAAGADWWRVTGFDPKAIPADALAREREAFLKVRARLDATGGWAIKEPRLCLLLPALADLLDGVRVVHVIRAPLEVANSLARRNGFPIHAGLALWEWYNLAALTASAGLPRILVDYNSLVADPAAAARRLGADLGLPELPFEEAASAVDPELRRERPEENADAFLSPAQQSLYRALRDGNPGAGAPSAAARIVLAEFEEDRSARLAHDQELTAAAARLRELAAKGITNPDDVDRLRMAADAAIAGEAELSERSRIFEARALRLIDLAARREGKWRELVARREQAVAADRESYGAALAAQREALDRRAHDAAALEEKLDAAQLSLRAARKKADAAAHQLKRMRNARTWKAMAPVRGAGSAARRLLVPRSDKAAVAVDRPRPPKAKVKAKQLLPATDMRVTPAAPGFEIEAEIRRLPPAVGHGHRDLGRLAFVTAIAGGYDPVFDPSLVDLHADYFLFSDAPAIDSAVWERREFDFFHADPARTARFVKTHPQLYFADYDAVVWVDGNLRINCLAEALISEENEAADIITWQHPLRDCVYEEAVECLKRAKDDPETIRAHVERLRAEGYPAKNGLVETSVLVLRHRRPAVVAFLNDWWRMVDNGSRRDQLSFNPALARHPELVVRFLAPRGVSMREDPRFGYSRHPSYRWA